MRGHRDFGTQEELRIPNGKINSLSSEKLRGSYFCAPKLRVGEREVTVKDLEDRGEILEVLPQILYLQIKQEVWYQPTLNSESLIGSC